MIRRHFCNAKEWERLYKNIPETIFYTTDYKEGVARFIFKTYCKREQTAIDRLIRAMEKPSYYDICYGETDFFEFNNAEFTTLSDGVYWYVYGKTPYEYHKIDFTKR